MNKKDNRLYSLGGLIIKKRNLQIIKVINMLRFFSSLYFFKIDYYPYSYDKYKKFFNELVKFVVYRNYLLNLNEFYFYFRTILNRNKIIKWKLGSEINFFLKEYKTKLISYVKKVHLKKYRQFLKLKFKFKFKNLKKINYLQKYRFKETVKKTRKQIIEENIKMQFFSNLVKRKNHLKIIHNYIKNRYKKSIKRRFLYLNKKKQKTTNRLIKDFSNDLVFKKIKRKRKYIQIGPRNIFKGNYEERNKAANDYLNLIRKGKSKKKIKYIFKKRRKKFLRKYFLIKKYKRKIFRRKKRTGILHFRIYYSNYYITLTDLSFNVIFSCSAGAVSDTSNKKTKMSNVISIPIFYRMLFFLRAFKIRQLKFVCRDRLDKIFFDAVKFFKKRGYKIKSISFVKKAPHHLGQRKQKPRRI